MGVRLGAGQSFHHQRSPSPREFPGAKSSESRLRVHDSHHQHLSQQRVPPLMKRRSWDTGMRYRSASPSSKPMRAGEARAWSIPVDPLPSHRPPCQEPCALRLRRCFARSAWDPSAARAFGCFRLERGKFLFVSAQSLTPHALLALQQQRS